MTKQKTTAQLQEKLRKEVFKGANSILPISKRINIEYDDPVIPLKIYKDDAKMVALMKRYELCIQYYERTICNILKTNKS